MGKLDSLRKVIREEVVNALRQELPRLIVEVKTSGFSNQEEEKTPVYEQTFVPTKKQAAAPKASVKPPKKTGNMIQDLLNETAHDMAKSGEWPGMEFGSQDVHGFGAQQMMPSMMQQGPVMIDGNEGYSPMNSAVPDFNGLMDKLIGNGTIK